LKKKSIKPALLVKHLQVLGASACLALRHRGGSRAGLYYRHKHDTQGVLRQSIRELAKTRIKWGDRHIHVLLRREGWRINAKHIHRLYGLEGLQLRDKTAKR